MSTNSFENFCNVIRKRSGISLSPDKTYLAESRLRPLMSELGMTDMNLFFEKVSLSSNDLLLNRVVDCMTTNESFFFRDDAPFEKLSSVVLPHLAAKKSSVRKLRIWCAACSSGQEPYSIAILLDEQSARWDGWQIEIVATDISTEMIKRANEGLFSDFEVNRGLSESRRKRYFEKLGAKWQIKSDIRRKVSFREFNLLDRPSNFGVFDLIFCRNVLIYFEPPIKQKILDTMSNILSNDGFLVLGAAETVVGLTKTLEPSQIAKGFFSTTKALGRSPEQRNDMTAKHKATVPAT